MAQTVRSNFDFGSIARCLNLPDPTNDGDAATKGWVEFNYIPASIYTSLWGLPLVMYKNVPASGSSSPGDVIISGPPFNVILIETWVSVITAQAGSNVQLRTAANNLGTVLSSGLSTAAVGYVRNANLASFRAPVKNANIYAYFTNRNVSCDIGALALAIPD